MIITFTKDETIELLKQTLTNKHADLLKDASMGYMDMNEFNIELSIYEDKKFLTITKREVTKQEDK